MTTREERIERLTELAAFLEKLQPAQLDISWGIPIVPKGRRPEQRKGCPLGWASTIPKLKDAGLSLLKGSEGVFQLSYDGSRGMEAARSFFGLTVHEAWMAFTPDGYQQHKITPEGAAQRLRLLARAQ